MQGETDVEFIKALVEDTRDEINRADTKSSILLSGSGIAVGIIAAGFTSAKWTLDGDPGVVQATAVLAFLSALVGTYLLGAAVYPRVGQPLAGRARYFAEQAQYPTVDALREAVNREAENVADRYLGQLKLLSSTATLKYRLMQGGELTLGCALAFAVLAGVLHHLLS